MRIEDLGRPRSKSSSSSLESQIICTPTAAARFSHFDRSLLYSFCPELRLQLVQCPLLEPSTFAPKPICVDAVFSKGCRVTSSVVGCNMSWRMRSDSKQHETMHTTDTPQVTQITEGGTHEQVEHTHSTWL